MDEQGSISAECNYPSHYANISGAKMHYIETGEGDPVLFVHGIPTSSYLWRNVFPTMSDVARCIAPDLIGMGKSERPDIEYRVFDHIKYLEQFINELDLKNITLVLHGWGSVIGFDIARRNQDRIKALAFFESHVRPTTDWNMLSLPVQQLATLLEREDASYHAVVEHNYLIEKLLPSGVIRTLSEEELNHYREPFIDEQSRRPLWQYLHDLPLGKGPDDVVALIQDYSDWLQKTDIPKLMMYAVPGFITTIDTVMWARDHLPNLTLVDLGDALHFAMESKPEFFGNTLREWYLQLPANKSLEVNA